eukprot:scaffold6508_cov158-Chaetoceros_neogracile.AAC.2
MARFTVEPVMALGVASLWPEVLKLFGHWAEMVCLASTAQQWKESDTDETVVLVASSCKARDAEKAAIRVSELRKLNSAHYTHVPCSIPININIADILAFKIGLDLLN